MLMRIKMRRRPRHQLLEKGELAAQFRFDRRPIARRNNLINRAPFPRSVPPFRNIEVQSYAELRMLTRVSRSLPGGGIAHHETGAGDDPTLMRFDDAAVDVCADPEVIGIHDETAVPRV